MAHAGSELLIAIWALLAPAALAGLGGSVPGIIIGVPVGLVFGVVLMLVLKKLGVFKREQPTWHKVSRAWLVFVPLSATLSVAGLGGTLGFQLAALTALEQTGRPLCDGVAQVAFYFLKELMKDGLVPPEVKTEADLVKWSGHFLEPLLEDEIQKKTGSQRVLLSAGKPVVVAASRVLAQVMIHEAFTAASEKSGLPPEQVRDAAIGILAAGNEKTERLAADKLLETLLEVARGLIFHGYVLSLIPLGVVLGACALDALAHALWRRRRKLPQAAAAPGAPGA